MQTNKNQFVMLITYTKKTCRYITVPYKVLFCWSENETILISR